MHKQQLKEAVCQLIDDKRGEIIKLGQQLYDHPEFGYKETFATGLVADQLEQLGLDLETEIAVTGCKARAEGKAPGPTVAVMGELDAILCHEHPDADPETGAVHACGHNIQTAVMYGVARGLLASGVMEELAGSVEFMGVPAEEYIELEYRSQLKEQGKIRYFGGKQELVHRGHLEDVDLAMMMHSLNLGRGGYRALVGPGGNGFLGKKVQFIGCEAHAGSAPEQGINALNAAMLALNNINALRETFPDEEKIRVHPIITKGGDIVNIVPADVRLESYVRGRSVAGIRNANHRVNQALKAGAMGVGAEVKINDIPGYLPLLDHPELDQLLSGNLDMFIQNDDIKQGSSFAGSFDFGDITHLMPGLHPFFGGVEGDLHTRDFRIVDRELAYIIPAKSLAMTVIDLLYDGAEEAREIVDNHQPVFSREEYLELLEGFDRLIEFSGGDL